jgi:tRNA(adenine34) deaminase
MIGHVGFHNDEFIAAGMEIALAAAEKAWREHGDVPVGAVILDPNGAVIATGVNKRELDRDPTAHAEIVAIREAGALLDNWRLDGCTLIVTLEPCAMCAGAILQSRITRLVFGAWDEKAGAVGSVVDLVRDPRALTKVEVITGVFAERSSALLKDFFVHTRS